MKKVIFAILVILLAGILLFAGWKAYEILHEYEAGKEFYKEMEQFVSVPAPQPTKPKTEEATTAPAEVVPEEPEKPKRPLDAQWPAVDFEALQQINPDVVGWVYIPDTQINYPILQGETNDTYIYHLLTGEYNSSGSIFMDAYIPRDFTAKNNSIYGHHMQNGTMFADIAEYREQSFYDAHPYALLVTPEGNYGVHIFSGYVTAAWTDAWKTDFSEDSFAQWLLEMEKRSYFASDVVPTEEDLIVTFSTCTYEYDNARFVVHGVLEKYS